MKIYSLREKATYCERDGEPVSFAAVDSIANWQDATSQHMIFYINKKYIINITVILNP